MNKKVKIKKSLNLIANKRNTESFVRNVPILLFFICLVFIVCKFGVIDRLNFIENYKEEVNTLNRDLYELQSIMKDYADVQKEFSTYTFRNMDKNNIDRLELLKLIDAKIGSICQVCSIEITGKTIKLSLKDLNFEKLSNLLKDLKNESIIKDVNVSNLDLTDVDSIIDMTIILKDLGDLEGDLFE